MFVWTVCPDDSQFIELDSDSDGFTVTVGEPNRDASDALKGSGENLIVAAGETLVVTENCPESPVVDLMAFQFYVKRANSANVTLLGNDGEIISSEVRNRNVLDYWYINYI